MLQGLFGWHTLLLIGMVIVPVVIVIVIAGFLRRKAADSGAAPVVSLTLWVGAVWAGLAVLGAVTTLIGTLSAPSVTMTVPVQPYWPQLPGVSIEPAEATVTMGSFTEAELTLESLPFVTRLLWGLGSMLGVLVPGAVAALIALMCFQLLRGAAFAPVVARGSMVTAVVVTVGGLASQVLCAIAGSMASEQALTISGAAIEGYPVDLDIWSIMPQPTFSMQVDLWPIGAGLAFAALAAVFTYGSKLERETAGLV